MMNLNQPANIRRSLVGLSWPINSATIQRKLWRRLSRQQESAQVLGWVEAFVFGSESVRYTAPMLVSAYISPTFIHRGQMDCLDENSPTLA